MAQGDSYLILLLILVTALSLSLVILVQSATFYYQAYLSAPVEITAFMDAVQFSVRENESCDCDIARIPRLDDKLRLNRLLEEIRRCGDDLSEDLDACFVEKGKRRLRAGVRLMWAGKRRSLEERMRRLDMLRLRFLTVHMGIISTIRPTQAMIPKPPPLPSPPMSPSRAGEKGSASFPTRPTLPHGLSEDMMSRSVTRAPPPRRLTTQAIGHNDNVSGGQKLGWGGVIEELKSSPRMRQRHASLELGNSR
jgi:hypothetical protein